MGLLKKISKKNLKIVLLTGLAIGMIVQFGIILGGTASLTLVVLLSALESIT